MHCADEDPYVEALALVRYIVLGGIMIHSVYSLLAAQRLQEKDSQCVCLRRWVAAGLQFAKYEGEHMLIYFGVSAALDTFNVFGTTAPPTGACRSDTLVALYSAALFTFLPNAFLAQALKKRGYSQKYPLSGAGIAVFVAALSFFIRLQVVLVTNYPKFVHDSFASWPIVARIFVAGATPPMADFVQAVLLIYVAKETHERADHSSIDTPALYVCLQT